MKRNLSKLLFQNPKLKTVLPILNGVNKKGGIYLVGGAVRDALLKRTPDDFDFAVSGSGIAFAQKFAKQTRGAFVLLSQPDDEARVVIDKTTYDFNGLGKKPLQNDLARRDYTVNAMAIDLRKPNTIIDKLNSRRHLKQKLLVPASENSLKLDPLRILRAFRLALELNFQVSDKVFLLARDITLTKIASERISYELLRICESTKSHKYVKQLYKLNLLEQILPQAIPLLRDKPLFAHSLRTYHKIELLVSRKSYFNRFQDEYDKYFTGFPFRRALLKITGLLHDIAKPQTQFKTSEGDVHFYGHDNLGAKMVKQLASEKLRLSRKQTQMLKDLVSYHMRLHLLATAPELTDRAIRRFFRDLGDEFFGLMILTYADGYATAKITSHLERTFTRMMKLKKADDSKKKVIRLINGNDLIALGYKPGPFFKTILQELEELQLDGKIKNKEQGLEYIKNHFPELTT
ncbi:MAG: CCA tRNA nucleotidyltransferase [Candidatus Latescibacteria bacterium]|nr:CCA tRNA nucleotidyltransferase [Candidatus Latescibacterota bacterium]